MGLKILSLLLLLLISYVWSPAQTLDYSNYHVVLEANFDSIKNIQQLKNTWQFRHDDTGFGWANYYDSSTQTTFEGEFYNEKRVSITKEGYLRLTAKRVNGRKKTYSVWLQKERRPMYESGMIQLRKDLTAGPFDFKNGVSGYIYGMFEIKVRFPATTDNFSAFWLTRAGTPTEIDMFEYGELNHRISNNVIDFSTHKDAYNLYVIPDSVDLINDFHVVTGVWTPDEVIFFFDGKISGRVPRSRNPTYDNSPLSIVANLGMRPYFHTRKTSMDIDYIRVYKPNNNDYNVSFMKPDY